MALGPQGKVRREREGSVLGEGDSGAGGLNQAGARAAHMTPPSIPEVSDVVGGPGEPDPGAAQHMDKVGDTEDVLCCLKGRVPPAQDQHVLTHEVLGIHGHGLITIRIFGAREVHLVGHRQAGGHEKDAAGGGQREDGLASQL